MKDKSIWKMAIVYSICFIFLVVLIEATWGITAGVIIGSNIGTDKVTQEEVSRILDEKGIKKPDISKLRNEEWYKKLQPEVQRDMERVIGEALKEINWFGVTLAVSVFVFAVVGFLCGYFSKAFISVGLIVVISFFVNNPIVRFPHAEALLLQEKIIVVLIQFVICYLFGYLGAYLGRKRAVS